MEDRYASCIAVAALFSVLTTTAVALRIQARRIRRNPLGWDDWTIIAAWILTLGLCVCNFIGAILGDMGKITPIVDGKPVLDKNKAIIRSQAVWVLQWLAALAPGLTKISVLLFYKRIFRGKVFTMLVWTLLALSVLWTVAFFFTDLLDCIPIQLNWAVSGAAAASKDGNTAGGCVNVIELFWSLTISDLLLDAFILMLPWYSVWQLKLPVRQKLSICGIFLLGAFVVVTGGIRLWAIKEALKPNSDHTYDRAPAFYWATIEAGTGVISACLPTMWPLLERASPESIIRSIRAKMSLSGSKGWSSASTDTTTSMAPPYGHNYSAKADTQVGTCTCKQGYYPRDGIVVEKRIEQV